MKHQRAQHSSQTVSLACWYWFISRFRFDTDPIHVDGEGFAFLSPSLWWVYIFWGLFFCSWAWAEMTRVYSTSYLLFVSRTFSAFNKKLHWSFNFQLCHQKYYFSLSHIKVIKLRRVDVMDFPNVMHLHQMRYLKRDFLVLAVIHPGRPFSSSRSAELISWAVFYSFLWRLRECLKMLWYFMCKDYVLNRRFDSVYYVSCD